MILFLITSLALLILLAFLNFSYLNSYFDSELSILNYFHFQQFNAFLSNLTLLNLSGKLLLFEYKNEMDLPNYSPELISSLINMQQLFTDNKVQLNKDLINLNSDFLDSHADLYVLYKDLSDYLNISYTIAKGADDFQVNTRDKISKVFWAFYTHQSNVIELSNISLYRYFITRTLSTSDNTYNLNDFNDIAYWKEIFFTPLNSIFYLHALHLKEISKNAFQNIQFYYYILAAVTGLILILQISIMIFSSGKLNKINQSFEKILTVKTGAFGSLLELYVLSLSKMECLSEFIINPLLKINVISEKVQINSFNLMNNKEEGNDLMSLRKKGNNDISVITSSNRKLVKRSTKISPNKINITNVETVNKNTTSNKKDNTLKLGYGIFSTNQELAKHIGLDTKRSKEELKQRLSKVENKIPIENVSDDENGLKYLEEPILNSKEIYDKLGFMLSEYIVYIIIILLKVGIIAFVTLNGLSSIKLKSRTFEAYSVFISSTVNPQILANKYIWKTFYSKFDYKPIKFTKFNLTDEVYRHSTFWLYVEFMNKVLIDQNGNYLNLDETKLTIESYHEY